MGKFDIFNKFSSAVIVVDEKKEVVFRNNLFKRVFSDFSTLKKFSHKFDCAVYALESNDVSATSPIFQALNSPEDFFAHVYYQTLNNKYLYYDMSASKKGKYSIIVFTDVTSKIESENLALRINDLQEYAEKLLIENKNLSKVKQQAQSQAKKLLLLNNISNIIRTS